MAFNIISKGYNRNVVETLGSFNIIEYTRDPSVHAYSALPEYFMSKMNVRRRQLMVEMDGKNSVVTQAGALQWSAGKIEATTGLTGAGDLFKKIVRGSVTNESAIKPEYKGVGTLVLEPSYKFIILQRVEDWGAFGMSVEDGMFLACEGSVVQKAVSRKSLSSFAMGNEGLFNLSLSGSGIVALESPVPADELIEITLNNDTLKIDGNLAVCWSTSLDFTVERSSKTLVGSSITGEGLLNVYRGTGKVLLCPTATTNTP